VVLVLRGPRKHQPQLSDFEPHLPAFQQALEALQTRNPLVALTWNGRGIAAALRDIDGRKMTNDSFMNSARAAGITGSGPALALVIPENQRSAVDRIKTWYTGRYKDIEILETSFLCSEVQDELE
jgi:shikimate kinase